MARLVNGARAIFGPPGICKTNKKACPYVRQKEDSVPHACPLSGKTCSAFVGLFVLINWARPTGNYFVAVSCGSIVKYP